jgi:hypothetical protein
LDGGADSCILGSHVHVLNHIKRYARLVGYDPDTTQSGRVPIVSAYIKTMDKCGNIALLLIHEAPSLAHSPTALLSEYQIREYGKVIDLCAENHVVSSNPRLMGRQRLDVNDNVHIPMEDRGAIMGIHILQYEENDDHRYPIHEITSKATWVPFRYQNSHISEDTSTTTVMSGSIHTLIAAAAHVANAEVQVETVDDDDELTQRLDDDSNSSDDDNVSELIPALIQRQFDDDSDKGDDDDEDNHSMPGLQQRCDDDTSSDDDSIGYQQKFEDENIDNLGTPINVITNKVEQINSDTVISGMVVPTTTSNDELEVDKSKVNSEILNVKKDFRKGW